MAKASLRAALQSGRFVAAPGLHDMIAAVVGNKVGLEFAYASGYWTTASAYGLPDAGIATYTQMLDRVATLCRSATPPSSPMPTPAMAACSTSTTPSRAMNPQVSSPSRSRIRNFPRNAATRPSSA